MQPGLFNFLSKHAGVHAADPEAQEELDKHFLKPGQWDEFKKKLRSKEFVKAVKLDDRSDSKLKRFAASIHQHLTGKGPSYTVPSQSSGKTYTVKFHPERKAFSCSCPDWTYAQSVKTKDKECKHVTMVKLELKAQSKMKKRASINAAALVLEVFG